MVTGLFICISMSSSFSCRHYCILHFLKELFHNKKRPDSKYSKSLLNLFYSTNYLIYLHQLLLKILSHISWNFCMSINLFRIYCTTAVHSFYIECAVKHFSKHNQPLANLVFYVPETHIMYLTHCCWFLKINTVHSTTHKNLLQQHSGT